MTTAQQGSTTTRAARPADVPRILELIHALAAFEREPDAVEMTEVELHDALFPGLGAATTHCEVADVDDEVVGIALWYVTFSTWTGGHGIWLEDLFLSPDQRGSGLGRSLLTRLARIAVEGGYRRLAWEVSDWNDSGIAFYNSLGGRPQGGHTTYRLDGAALQGLGYA